MVVTKHNLHLRYFTDDLSSTAVQLKNKIREALRNNDDIVNADVDVETCYHLIVDAESQKHFEAQYMDRLVWLLSEDMLNPSLRKRSKFLNTVEVIEIGPNLAFVSPFSTNAVSVFKAANILGVKRLEVTKRYMITCASNFSKEKLLPLIRDQMLESEYTDNISFDRFTRTGNDYCVDEATLKNDFRNANKLLGFELDNDDVDYYYNLFVKVMKRNPTDVELYDLVLSNSENCRQTFFKGKLFIDGKERSDSLFRSMQSTQIYSNPNNLITFSRNSSVIKGFKTHCLKSLNPIVFSEMDFLPCTRHIIYSAKTHNFSTGVCPFAEAAAATGERIRNIHATSRGAHEIAAIAGYSVGNLHLKDYPLQWEPACIYHDCMKLPKDILIEASNGASDYGNKFGEPIICGFARTFGQILPKGERCEYLKPIIFSGGIGAIDDLQIKKLSQAEQAWLVKIGGPAYRTGPGTSTGSFVQTQDCKSCQNYEVAQRVDPEMEQKLHRVIRSCTEFGDENPLISILDQGTGGNGNVLKGLISNKYGAVIETSKFELGDPTLSLRELWCAEYQENDAALVDPKKTATLEMVAKREKCSVSFIGRLNNTQTITLLDDINNPALTPLSIPNAMHGRLPKKFYLDSTKDNVKALVIPDKLTVMNALSLILRLPSVASKRYLTNKVDRSVTGLIARQQCVGPLQTPVADVGVVALSHWDIVGAAVAVGEQPVKGLVSPEAGARMSLAEALTNLVFAPITCRKDVKCNGSWMWAAEIAGEGVKLTRACDAVCEAMKEVGVAIDGMKDSLCLAAKVRNETVKAPGTFAVSVYAPCINITKVVTPDLKGPTDQTPTHLIYIRFGNNGLVNRLGGTALAQCLSQIGATTCDIEDFEKFGKAFDIVQKLIKEDRILSGHDISDGGLITCALEMAMAGNRTMILQLMFPSSTLENLFAEEAGVIIEVEDREVQDIINTFSVADIFAVDIGFATKETGPNAVAIVKMNYTDILHESIANIRNIWEETSNQLELLQTDHKCVDEQKRWLNQAINPVYRADFDYSNAKIDFKMQRMLKPYSVAIVREEGSNGDREMAAAFYLAGFAVFDVTMEDFLHPQFSLRLFNGIAFVGGFTYGDSLGAAKGWASMISYHEKILNEIESFRFRSDTFSLGVSNGCQLMTLLGWVGTTNGTKERTIQLRQNDCGRFQSSFSSVRISKSPSLFFTGMEDSILGVWSACSEGKFCFKNEQLLNELEANCLVPVYYCDASGSPTMSYPENPSGSTRGIAAISSADGRHLAIMPHPERSFFSWQWPYYPREWKKDCFNSSPWSENYEYKNSPWMRMFLNAYEWTHQNAGF